MTQLSRAVMERRAPNVVEADDAKTALYRKLEFFPTPPWAARAGAELVRQIDPQARDVWEPAAGEGHMAEPLRQYFAKVRPSDIHDYGRGYSVTDFLLDDGPPVTDWLITNPPFRLGAEFIIHGLARARRGVAILARTAFLEGAERYHAIYCPPYPMTQFSPFCERVGMSLGGWDAETSTATSYAWFFFAKTAAAAKRAEVVHIPPGTKFRLTRADDVAKFGAKKPVAPAPLLDGV